MRAPKQVDFEELGITSDDQLQEFAIDRGFSFNYIGFVDEMQPSQIPLEHNLINLGGVKTFNSGTHWVYLYNDPKGKFSLYFDSLGAGPPDEIYEHAFAPLFINKKQIQRFDEEHCGIYVVNMASFVERANDKRNAIKNFTKFYKDVSGVEYKDIHL